jgi:hypothetical protein
VFENISFTIGLNTNRSQKIGGSNMTVKINEIKFGRRKYNREDKVKGQWVFGGVEHKSGKDISSSRSGQNCGQDWVEPGTTVISNCW